MPTPTASRWYVLLLDSFAFAPVHEVQADTHEHDEGAATHRFLRGGAVVYQIPARHVQEVVACDTQKAAADRAREHRELLMGARATRGIVEGGVAPRRGSRPGQTSPAVSGQIAEGLSIRIEER